uniref:Xrn1 N-terminal domain-containing protein n=1 Tax=viral metagenome TaxID=1070528 RepID=A0A6C0LZK6_9ZZZZ
MGIKHFFMWFKRNHSEYMIGMRKDDTFHTIGVNINTLMIDMNGVFHNSTQKIYQYGNFKPNPRLLRKGRSHPRGLRAQLAVFEDVCKTVEHLFKKTKPNKRLILCVDGPAPISKQNQQRQRRFKSAKEGAGGEHFDSNCITPGTQFMDYLSKYIDWYIRKRIGEDRDWKNIQVIFSNEKAAGEGEQKCIQYIRFHGKKNETYCIHGMDADIIMLSMGTHMPKFYIIRDEMYDKTLEHYCIDIGASRKSLAKRLEWVSKKHEFNPRSAINDFVFLCFMVGNDFLPHIPSIEIIENGIELILEVYKEVCSSYGHITQTTNRGSIRFVHAPLRVFLGTIGHHEKKNLEHKLQSRRSYFEDKLLDSCSTQRGQKWEVDIEKYKKDYWDQLMKGDEKKVCHQYLEGMQWVLSYYTSGVPDWSWQFIHHYAPPASILAKHVSTFSFVNYSHTVPSTPFQQLLSVLPPQSAHLIPSPLCNLLTDKDSPLNAQCPDKIEVDLAGKRREWEGIVLLPMVDFDPVRDLYFDALEKVKPQDSSRNVRGRSWFYKSLPEKRRLFKSFHGDIPDCSVYTVFIDL